MKVPSPRRMLSPVLLLGAGRGEATCGILYLAGFLRRNGVEAFVRLYDDDGTEEEMEQSLAELLSHVRPRLVGISMKWFNHLSRGLFIAQTVRAYDADIRIVVGGNSASYYWRELAQYDCIDDIVLGDGERPLLALAQGVRSPPNCVTRDKDGNALRAPLEYVQSVKSDEVYYSNFDDIFLSGMDRHSFSGWVQPGKGCSENCVYCGGTRGMEQAAFGRPTSFLRPVQSVRKDHLEIADRSWQLRYDFAGGTEAFLSAAWQGFNLSNHSVTYFLWGVPPPSLMESLARTFERVYVVLDIGCFGQSQRQDLMRRGLLKPCPTDQELLRTVEFCRQFQNLKLEVCGIAGLPHSTAQALKEELPLVDKLLELGCDVGCQRLESQPGALVTQHAKRFGMVADAHTFEGFVSWFGDRGHATDAEFPMVRFSDAQWEHKTQRAFERLYSTISAVKRPTRASENSVWSSTAQAKVVTTLGDWLGQYRVPASLRNETVHVFRSRDGAGLACALGRGASRFESRYVYTGVPGATAAAVLELFEKPLSKRDAIAQLARHKRLPTGHASEAIEGLIDGGFLARQVT